MQKKYPKYQDYVIKNGKFIGQFEKMYQEFDDPWEQSKKNKISSSKKIALNFIQKSKAKKVIELGAGLGQFTNEIKKCGVDVMGIDISKTAIKKAKQNYPDCNFKVGDILDFHIYQKYNPDIIVMAQITWYVLDKLDAFINYFKNNLPNTYLIHLLTTYPRNNQSYGKEKFTNLNQILKYFEAEYLSSGEFSVLESKDKDTYFIGKWKK